MKNIIAVFIVFLAPIYLIARDQMDYGQAHAENPPISSKKNFITKPDKPQSAPSTMSEEHKKIFEQLKQKHNELPKNIQTEIKNFLHERKKIEEAKIKLYKSLSREAKKALDEEKKLKRKLKKVDKSPTSEDNIKIFKTSTNIQK